MNSLLAPSLARREIELQPGKRGEKGLKDKILNRFPDDTSGPRCRIPACLFGRLRRRSCRCWCALVARAREEAAKEPFQNPHKTLLSPFAEPNTCPSGRLPRGLRQHSQARPCCDASALSIRRAPYSRSLLSRGEHTRAGVVSALSRDNLSKL